MPRAQLPRHWTYKRGRAVYQYTVPYVLGERAARTRARVPIGATVPETRRPVPLPIISIIRFTNRR